MATLYEHSGIAPAVGIVLTFLGGLVSAVALAWVYSYADVYVPIIYANFLLTAGFGFCIGAAVTYAAKLGHVRNVLVPTIIAVVAACVGLYVAWGVDRLARVGFPADADALAVFTPQELKRYIHFYYEHGFWTITSGHGGAGKGASNVSGIPLAILWTIEAAVIVVGAGMTARVFMADFVYCERCQLWLKTQSDVRRLGLFKESAHYEQLAEGDLSPLVDAARVDPQAKDYLKLDLTSCEACGESNYLTLSRVTTTLDKHKKETTNNQKLIDRLAIAPADVPLVREAGKEPAPASDATAGPPAAS
jgi:hypothetical protein